MHGALVRSGLSGRCQPRRPDLKESSSVPGAAVVEQIRHQLDDRLFLFRLAPRRHERDRGQRIRGDDSLAVVAMQCNIDAELIGEQSGGAALVPVGERVVFHDEIEQVNCFLLNTRVQVLTGEGLLTAPRIPRNESLLSTRRTLRLSGPFHRPRRQRRAHSRSRAGQPTWFPVES